jgi:3-isopropylmalate/(R)-2-methylmalate dehydratase small subunit
VQVSETFLKKIFNAIEEDPKTRLDINLEEQIIRVLNSNESEHFEINPYKKKCLLNGYDDIDYLLSIKGEIEAFARSKS